MDTTNTLWLDSVINDLEKRKADHRRNRSEGHWDGYCSSISDTTNSDEAVRDDIRRRERMAEACYEI